jgi:hypothetical membrane protein
MPKEVTLTAAHVHLVLNHAPVLFLALGLSILVASLWLKSEPVRRTGLVLLILAGLIAIPTLLTGEGAEEIVEHLPNVSETSIEAHEEFAEKAIWSIYLVSALSALALGLSWRRGQTTRWIDRLLILACIGALGAVAWTNNLGGQISHPELRGTQQPS